MKIDDKMWVQLPELLQTCVSYANKMREHKNELDNIRAILVVNFGPSGRISTIVEDVDQTTEYILLQVLTKLVKDFRK